MLQPPRPPACAFRAGGGARPASTGQGSPPFLCCPPVPGRARLARRVLVGADSAVAGPRRVAIAPGVALRGQCGPGRSRGSARDRRAVVGLCGGLAAAGGCTGSSAIRAGWPLSGLAGLPSALRRLTGGPVRLLGRFCRGRATLFGTPGAALPRRVLPLPRSGSPRSVGQRARSSSAVRVRPAGVFACPWQVLRG